MAIVASRFDEVPPRSAPRLEDVSPSASRRTAQRDVKICGSARAGPPPPRPRNVWRRRRDLRFTRPVVPNRRRAAHALDVLIPQPVVRPLGHSVRNHLLGGNNRTESDHDAGRGGVCARCCPLGNDRSVDMLRLRLYAVHALSRTHDWLDDDPPWGRTHDCERNRVDASTEEGMVRTVDASRLYVERERHENALVERFEGLRTVYIEPVIDHGPELPQEFVHSRVFGGNLDERHRLRALRKLEDTNHASPSEEQRVPRRAHGAGHLPGRVGVFQQRFEFLLLPRLRPEREGDEHRHGYGLAVTDIAGARLSAITSQWSPPSRVENTCPCSVAMYTPTGSCPSDPTPSRRIVRCAGLGSPVVSRCHARPRFRVRYTAISPSVVRSPSLFKGTTYALPPSDPTARPKPKELDSPRDTSSHRPRPSSHRKTPQWCCW